MRLRLFVAAWVTLLLVTVALSLWSNHESCLRANGVRNAAFVTYEGDAHRATQRIAIDRGQRQRIDEEALGADLSAIKLVQPIDCNAIFLPGTR